MFNFLKIFKNFPGEAGKNGGREREEKSNFIRPKSTFGQHQATEIAFEITIYAEKLLFSKATHARGSVWDRNVVYETRKLTLIPQKYLGIHRTSSCH